jgi:hypothetical protein
VQPDTTMTMSPVRVPLTLAAALAFHVAMSPPSTSHADTAGDRRAVRASARFITAMLTKGLYWASALTDTLVLLVPHATTSLPTLPPISLPRVGALSSWIRPPTQWGLGLPLSLPLPSPPPLPLAIIAGTTIAFAGAFLRYAAYSALGQFYACPNQGPGPCTPIPRGARSHAHARGHAHALITTGPYAFVRHPGYAGLALCTTGLAVLQLDALMDKVYLGSGSSGVASWGVGEGVSVAMRTVALVCAILGTVGAVRRIRDEERALRVRFKGEWEAWAGRVRYRLVPGVY